jgi:hypothetical protein
MFRTSIGSRPLREYKPDAFMCVRLFEPSSLKCGGWTSSKEPISNCGPGWFRSEQSEITELPIAYVVIRVNFPCQHNDVVIGKKRLPSCHLDNFG